MFQSNQEQNVSYILGNKFEALFPSIFTIIATLLSLTIIIIVLTKFLYNPIKKLHDERRKYIQDNIDVAEKENKQATLDREQANKELILARLKANKIIEKAKSEVLEVKETKINLAKKEAKKIIEDANKKIKSQKIKFEEDSKKIIVDVALSAAKKIIEKEIDSKTNQKIIEDFIKVKK